MRRPLALLVGLLLTACGGSPSTTTPVTASLSVDIGGLPAAAAADVTVTGPAGFTRTLHASGILDTLPAGDYTVTAADVIAEGTTYYGAATPPTVHLSGGSASVTVTYVAAAPPPVTGTTGALRVEVVGLPAGTAPSATLTDGAGRTTAVTAAGNLPALPAGVYTVTVTPVVSGGVTYTGTAPGSVEVGGSSTPVLTLSYRQAALRVRALPTSVGTGTVTVLVADLADPADHVTWTATGGYFLASDALPTAEGTPVAWVAPATAGTATITVRSGLHPEVTETMTVAVTAQGVPEWTARFGGAYSDDGTAVAVDAAGNTYVAGTRATAGGGGNRALFLTKVDPTGQELWTNTFGAPSGGTARSMAITATGTVYVTGESPYDTWAGTTAGPYLAAFTAGGTLKWVKSLPTGTTFSNALALTSGGDVLIAGTATGNVDGLHPEPTRGSAFLLRLSSDGQLRWARQYALTRGSTEQGTGVAVDSLGSVYLLGTTTGPADYSNPNTQVRDDVLVAKYDAAGTQAWLQPLGVNATSSAQAWDIAGTPGGGAALVWNAGASSRITQLRPDGSLLWETPVAVSGTSGMVQARKIRVDANGQAIVMGSASALSQPAPPGNSFVARYTPQGVWAWSRRFGLKSGTEAQALALSPDGGLIVTGSSWVDFDLPSLGEYDTFVLRLGR